MVKHEKVKIISMTDGKEIRTGSARSTDISTYNVEFRNGLILVVLAAVLASIGCIAGGFIESQKSGAVNGQILVDIKNGQDKISVAQEKMWSVISRYNDKLACVQSSVSNCCPNYKYCV